MLFTEPLFVFYFLPISFFLHQLAIRKSGASYPKAAALLFFFLSLGFYYFQDPFWLLPFLFIFLIDSIYLFVIRRIHNQQQRKIVLSIFIVLNLLPLFIFKYSDWIFHSIEVQSFGKKVALPAGISFYTFESISLLLDVYRREVGLPIAPAYIACFLGMFPRLIAGPIVRFEYLMKQFKQYTKPQIEKGLLLFVIGFSLKCLFADSFAFYTQYAFDRKTEIDVVSAWLGIGAYALQLYYDFYGYSLMAIGLGHLFGFSLPWNFDLPFHSKSITEFWNRWHITLGVWVKTYLYLPLALKNRHSKAKTLLIVFFTMFIVGLWHGSGMCFIIYGAWFGFWLVIDYAMDPFSRFPGFISKTLTFGIVLVGFLLMRSEDFFEFKRVFTALFQLKGTFNPTALTSGFMRLSLTLSGLIFCFVIEPYIPLRNWNETPYLKSKAVFSMIGIFLFLLSLMVSYSSKMIPFLYFQF